MDPIVAQVIERLSQRSNQLSEITYSKGIPTPTDDVFVKSGNVILKKVSIELITDLSRINSTNTWVSWILKGLDYEVNLQLDVSKHAVNFIPLTLLRDWPILFVVDGGRPIYAFYEKTLVRSKLASIPDNSVVILTSKQRLTDEAAEISTRKNLKIQVRTDENCIWQKW